MNPRRFHFPAYRPLAAALCCATLAASVGCAGMAGGRADSRFGGYQRTPVSVAEAIHDADESPDASDAPAATASYAEEPKEQETPDPVYPLDPPPESPAERVMRDAGELVDQGDLVGARKILLVAARRGPLEPALCVALARVNESLGNWSEAADWYAAVDEHPDADDSPVSSDRRLRQRARCLYRAGNTTAACLIWSECLTQDDRAVPLGELLEYADASLRSDDHETAQRLLDQVSQRTGRRSREVELLRVACALRRGDAREAETIATAALYEWPREKRFVDLAALARVEDDDPRYEAEDGAPATAPGSGTDDEPNSDDME